MSQARYVISYVEQDLYQLQEGNYTMTAADLATNVRNLSAIVNHLRTNVADGDPARAAVVLRSATRAVEGLNAYAATQN